MMIKSAWIRPEDSHHYRTLGIDSLLLPRHREKLRYRTQNGRLRNTRSSQVPQLAAEAAQIVTRQLLKCSGLEKREIGFWAVHPGGTTVLEAVGETLELCRHDLRYSYEVFEQYGNMSSPSVLFALKKLIEQERPAPGDKARCLAMGYLPDACSSLLFSVDSSEAGGLKFVVFVTLHFAE
jgi:predicted naringenin-chalcone synthase